MTGGGVLLGIALAFAGTRLLQSMLYEVSSTDARLYVAAVIVVLLVTGVAMGIPARRASVADPAGALRAE